METSALPQRKQNYNSASFFLALCIYCPLVFACVTWTEHLRSKVSLKADDEVVKIMVKALVPPPPPQVEAPQAPEQVSPPEVKPPEPPRIQPETKPKPLPPVKKPKIVKKKSPEKKTAENIPVSDTKTQPQAAQVQQAVSGASSPASAGPVTMVYGKTRDTMMSRIVESLRKGLYYPPQARRRGQQGVVLVGFIIKAGGGVENIRVLKSSTDAEILKQAAMTTVRNASGSFPKTGRDINVVVPIEFKLR